MTMPIFPADVLERAARIRLIGFDVDGTLTDGRLYIAADSSCRRRNQRSTLAGVVRRQIQATNTIISEPNTKPNKGETKIKATVRMMPVAISALVPALAITAPTIPPINACEELLGIP